MSIAVPTRRLGVALDVRSPRQATLEAVGIAEHHRCFMCGSLNPMGMKLEFCVERDGSVVAEFSFSELFAGYPGVLHGGIIAALLDAAMTNALFSLGVVAVTAELSVRFVAPVTPDRSGLIRGLVERGDEHPLYLVRAELEQDMKLMARASAKFWSKGS